MSEPEKTMRSFLQRWSERKLAAAEPADAAQEIPPGEAAAPTPDAPLDIAPEPVAPAFDPESLPPIESIDATTDIRAFLAPGVPAELTRAALRRAWVSDPTIRDFIGIAENQWDFTQPGGVPGLGSMEHALELRRLFAALPGDTAPDVTTGHSEASAADADADKASGEAVVAELPAASCAEAGVATQNSAGDASPGAENAAAQNTAMQNPDDGEAPVRRRHGGALPR